MLARLQPLLLEQTNQVPCEPAWPAGGVLLPGSFSPLHAGHLAMAAVAQEWFKSPVCFELSISNVDKPLLDAAELCRRLHQFGDDQSVLVTRAAKFIDKARLAPGARFAVGIDTILRLSDPRYASSRGAQPQMLDELSAICGGFLVFGRVLEDRFRMLADVDLPSPLADICSAVPADIFRRDISSSQLRGTLDGQTGGERRDTS